MRARASFGQPVLCVIGPAAGAKAAQIDGPLQAGFLGCNLEVLGGQAILFGKSLDSRAPGPAPWNGPGNRLPEGPSSDQCPGQDRLPPIQCLTGLDTGSETFLENVPGIGAECLVPGNAAAA